MTFDPEINEFTDWARRSPEPAAAQLNPAVKSKLVPSLRSLA